MAPMGEIPMFNGFVFFQHAIALDIVGPFFKIKMLCLIADVNLPKFKTPCYYP